MFRTPTISTAHLVHVPLFSACTAKQLAKVARLFDEVTVPAGKVLVEQGSVDFEFYVIVDGSVEVTVNANPVAVLGAGDYFGELAPLDKHPRSATVTTTSETTLLVMTPRNFSTAVSTVPGLAPKLMAGLTARIRESNGTPTAA